jgi:uncharacterized protein YceH (UPF0502 family)
MALLDTFSFVKTFRNAGNDEDRAAAIASLVNGLVESNGAAAATRADLARVAGDIVKIEQKVSSLGEELAQPVTTALNAATSGLARDMGGLRGDLQERVAALEAKVETLNKELGNRVEMQSDRVGSAGRRVIFWNFLFLLLFAAGAFYAALNWPMISGMAKQAMAPAAETVAPAAPAASTNSGN